VLSQLYRRGVLAALAPPGTPIVDVLLLSPDGETVAATVQVKTRTRWQSPGWFMDRKHETLTDERMFYALIDLEDEPPLTFIIPTAVAAHVVAAAHEDVIGGAGLQFGDGDGVVAGEDGEDHEPSVRVVVVGAPCRAPLWRLVAVLAPRRAPHCGSPVPAELM
jgi:hypothetical protein